MSLQFMHMAVESSIASKRHQPASDSAEYTCSRQGKAFFFLAEEWTFSRPVNRFAPNRYCEMIASSFARDP